MIERILFGSTGHMSTRTIFGAAALGSMRQGKADAVLETLLEFGVNHIDTAAGYGASELRIAPWMATHRDRFFLATKTGARDAKGARESLERSLDRLGVGHVDLIQLHNLVEEEEQKVAFGPDGALEALVARARCGPGAIYRRHRPRHLCPAPSRRESAAVPVRLCARAVQLHHACAGRVPARFRGTLRDMPRAWRCVSDHQEHRSPPVVARRRRAAPLLVSTDPRPRRVAARGALRPFPSGHFPEHVQRHDAAARNPRSRRHDRGSADGS